MHRANFGRIVGLHNLKAMGITIMHAHQKEAVRNSINNSAAFDGNISYRQAKTRDELEQAFHLVWGAYVRVGLQAEDDYNIRLTKYHLLPESKVFIAASKQCDENGVEYEKVIGTITIVPDSIFGLPADSVAQDGIAELRRDGNKAVEFIALASDDEGTQQRIILKLFRLAYEYCRINGYSTILASLTDRHIGFYRRFLDFKPIGELLPYEMGNGIPVQAHYIDIAESADFIEKRAESFNRDSSWWSFWNYHSQDLLTQAKNHRPWCTEQIRYFVSKSNDFASQLDDKTTMLLEMHYQKFDEKYSMSAALSNPDQLRRPEVGGSRKLSLNFGRSVVNYATRLGRRVSFNIGTNSGRVTATG